MITRIDMANLILSFPIVRDLSGELHREVRSKAEQLRARNDEIVFDLSCPCRGLAMITRGTVRVVRAMSEERRFLFYRLRPGKVCVLTACCLAGESRSAACGISEGNVQGVWLPRQLFHAMLAASSSFRTFVFEAFAQRLTGIMRLAEHLVSRKLDQRLAGLILEKDDPITLSHQKLADELGSAREVVSRILKDFEGRGLLELGRERIHLLDRGRLEHLTLSV